MKTISPIFFYAILLIFISSCSENNSTNINNQKIFFETGELKSYEEFDVNNINEGKSIYYFRNGNIKLEGSYKNGLKEGSFKEYYEDTGKLKSIWYCKNGLKYGISEWYYNNSGNLETKAIFRFDKLNGICKSYYENGNIRDSSYFVDGKRQNNRILYHENGNLKMYFFYNEFGEMSYKRTYDSNGVFKAHYGSYFGSRQLFDKPFYNVGDTFSFNLFVAKPIDWDYKLYCTELDDNDSIINKHQIYLDENIYKFEKVLKTIDKVTYTFLIEFPNQVDRPKEELELIIVPDGLTELELNYDKESLSMFKEGEVY